MTALAFLRTALLSSAAADGTDLDSRSIGFDLLRAEVEQRSVAGEDVVQANGHLERFVSVLEVASCFRVFSVIDLFREFFAGARVEADEAESAVEEYRATGHCIHGIIFDEDAAVYGPHGFHLFPCAVATFGGCGEEAPDEGAIACTQAVNPAIFSPEVHAALGEAGR